MTDTDNGFATKDTEVTKNGNGEKKCYDNGDGSDTKINKGRKGKIPNLKSQIPNQFLPFSGL